MWNSTSSNTIHTTTPAEAIKRAKGELVARVLAVEIISKDKKHFAAYTIDVGFSRLNWRVSRRFSEFFAFDKQIRNNYPLVKDAPPLPSRRKKSMSVGFLEKRKTSLNVYLQQLLALLPLAVEIQKCEELMHFLHITFHLRKSISAHRQSVAREYFPNIYSSLPPNRLTRRMAHINDMFCIEGNSPIHWAAKQGFWEEVIAIIKSTPGIVLLEDLIGQTALHYAARYGQSHIVRLLVTHGAAVNAQCSKGWTPLQCACISCDLQCVLTLLEDENIDVNIKNTDGNTALHYLARTFDNIDETTAKNCIKSFVDKGGNVNAINILAETPLHNACWKGCTDIVEALLLYGANPNLQNTSNEPPLHWAAREKHEKVVAILIEHGADVNLRSLFGPAMNFPMVTSIYNEVMRDRADIKDQVEDKRLTSSQTDAYAQNESLYTIASDEDEVKIEAMWTKGLVTRRPEIEIMQYNPYVGNFVDDNERGEKEVGGAGKEQEERTVREKEIKEHGEQSKEHSEKEKEADERDEGENRKEESNSPTLSDNSYSSFETEMRVIPKFVMVTELTPPEVGGHIPIPVDLQEVCVDVYEMDFNEEFVSDTQ